MQDKTVHLFTLYIKEKEQTGKATKHVRYGMNIYFQYLSETDLHPLLLKIRDAQEFQVYLTTSTRADGTIRFTRASVLNIVGSVSNFYEYLRRKKHIHANPFKEIDRVRRSDALPRNILNETNMDLLLKHFKHFMKGRNLTEKRQLYRAHVLGELMYSTGMRINEVTSLKESDIDLVRGIVTVNDRKNRKKREAILNTFTGQVLSIYITDMRKHLLHTKNKADTRLLFGSKTNLRIWFNAILDRESTKLKFGKFTTHNFRHAVGYHLLRGGCDISFIQKILGHESLQSTQVYTKVDKEDLKQVIDTYHPRTFHERD